MINGLILEENCIGLTENNLRLPLHVIAEESSLDNIEDAHTLLKDLKIKNLMGIVIA